MFKGCSCIVAVTSFFLIGCGSEEAQGPETVPVSGTIYLDGEPLDDAEVHFFTEEFDAVGVSNSEGRYELVQGAVPGENKVYVVKMEGGEDPLAKYGDPAETGMDEIQLQTAAEAEGKSAGDLLPKSIVPPEYSDPEKTKLSYKVPEGGTEKADLRLSRE